MFKNTVKAAKDLGVIGLEQLSIDGSILKASVSKNSVVIIDVLGVIGEYINNELKKVIERDKVEDIHFGNCRSYDQLNRNGKNEVKATVAKCIKQVNEAKYDDREKENN